MTLPLFQLNKKRRLRIVTSFHCLIGLSNAIFDCFLKKSYAQHFYGFEKRLHDEKIQFLRSIVLLKLLCTRQRKRLFFKQCSEKVIDPLMQWIRILEEIHDLLMECAQLRYRVDDFSTFTVCDVPLARIVNCLTNCFFAMSQCILHKSQSMPSMGIDLLFEAVSELHDYCEKILGLVSNQVIAFFMFVNHLFELHAKILIFTRVVFETQEALL